MKKKRQSKVVGVKLRAGGDLHGSEKPGWSNGDMAWKYTTPKMNNNKTKTS